MSKKKSKLSVNLVASAFLVPSLFFLNIQVANADGVTQKNDYELTATASIATDYLFRGVSQTLEDPAVQASFDFSHVSGVFGGIWSSNVDFQDRGPIDDQADQEIDVYLGYGADINSDWSADATIVRYIFPGTASDSDLDWNEFLASVHYRDSVSFLVAYSSNVFNVDENGIYYNLSGRYPINDAIDITASVGYYDLDDALNDSYKDYSLGVEYSHGMFTTRLAYIDSDSSGEDLFGKNADSRVVLSLTATLGN